MASATVAGAPRREIIAGHEHASNGKDELNGFETLDGNCGMSSSSGPPETNPRAIPRGSTQSSVGRYLPENIVFDISVHTTRPLGCSEVTCCIFNCFYSIVDIIPRCHEFDSFTRQTSRMYTLL